MTKEIMTEVISNIINDVNTKAKDGRLQADHLSAFTAFLQVPTIRSIIFEKI